MGSGTYLERLLANEAIAEIHSDPVTARLQCIRRWRCEVHYLLGFTGASGFLSDQVTVGGKPLHLDLRITGCAADIHSQLDPISSREFSRISRRSPGSDELHSPVPG